MYTPIKMAQTRKLTERQHDQPGKHLTKKTYELSMKWLQARYLSFPNSGFSIYKLHMNTMVI